MKTLLTSVIYFLKKCHIINDITIAKLKYRYKCHKKLDLANPKDINEKINWLKFYGDTSMWADLADKYKVREYVEQKGYKDILVKLYGKWNSTEEIDWESLPDEFVMKANNGCGDIIICTDKSKLDKKKVVEHFNKTLSKTYGVESGEPHYASIKPCIIAEELLDKDKQDIVSNSLVDYKIYCFNGEPCYIFIAANRNSKIVNVGLYDNVWNNLFDYLVPNNHYSPLMGSVSKPKTFDAMMKIAKTLSQGFPIVRVDLYEVAGHVYFGELTFTPQGGYLYNFNNELLNIMGSKIDVNYGKQ